MHVYKFRNCLLNTAERSLIQERHHIKLTTKTFDVLQYLVENSGKVVSKDELLGHVWNGNFVEESNLPVHISKLRRTLSESPDCRYIETVQGTGYRFVAPVTVAGYDVWRRGVLASSSANTLEDKSLRSIAVLPFENDARDSELSYLADGLAESITNNLAVVPSLKVIARDTAFRYRNRTVDAKEVGETLDVDAILTGRIRISERTIVLNLELIEVRRGTQIWGHQFAGKTEEILLLHGEISSLVVEKLRSSPRKLQGLENSQATKNSGSYKLYLKGKYFTEKRTLSGIKQAADCFTQSITLDPQNVHAYAELIDCYRFLYVIDGISLRQTLESIAPYLLSLSSQARAIDVVQHVYSGLKLQLDWDVYRADEHAQKALEINPNCVEALHRRIEILLIMGRFDEAVEHIDKVLEIDPLSVLTYKRIAKWYYGMRNYEAALSFLSDAHDLEPFDYENLAILGAVLTEIGEYQEALTHFKRSMDSHPTAEVLSMIGYVHALTDNRQDVYPILSELQGDSIDPKKHALKLARIHLALGDLEATFTLMEAAVERHEIDLTAITYDPRWDRIRSDPRFQEIVKRIGFPT